ncbi:MAG: hypothetical protein LBF51_07275 [Zoogloeaceae bacterium]|jgi:hypothetical protein|nr:hypothetical protein [Zoogloeaceae bacterium]
MTFQKNIDYDQGFGVVGEIAFDGPTRALPGVLKSAVAANNVVGRWFTRNADGTFGAGGTGAEGGILANPKTYAAQGTIADGTLAPTLTLRNDEVVEFVTEGEIIVSLAAAAAQGDDVHYATATGILKAVAPGTAPVTGYAAVPGAKVSRFPQENGTGGLAVIWLAKGNTTYNITIE